MAAEVERVCGPAEAAGYRRFVDYVSALYRVEMRSFIDRNLDSPLGLLGPDLLRLLRCAGSAGSHPPSPGYLKDPRTQRVFSFQAMYAGLSPYDGAGDLRGDRLHGHDGRGVVPARRDARGAAGARRSGGEARRPVPVRHRGHPGRGRRRPGPGRAHHRRRADRGRRGRAQPRPAGRVPGPAAAGRRAAAASAAALLAVVRGAARRLDRRVQRDRPSQHPLRPGLAAHVRRDHPATAGSCPTRRCWSPTRPGPTRPWRRRAAGLLRAARRPRTSPPASTGPAPGRATGTSWSPSSRPAATPGSAPGSRSSGWSRRPTGPRAGWRAGTPFAAAHTFAPDRAVPAADAARGLETSCSPAPGTQPGRRRADGAAVRAAGGRADHRPAAVGGERP